MKIIGLILPTLLLFSINIHAQFKSYSKGHYYNNEGEKVFGLFKYRKATFDVFGSKPSLIKFKSSKKSKAVKLRAKDVKAFMVESDSFCVVKNIKINSLGGEYLQDFAKVVISGPMNLYVHYSSSSDGQTSYENDRYVLSLEGSDSFFGLWNINRQREELANLFYKAPTLFHQILEKEYNYTDIPKIVEKYNEYAKRDQEQVKVKKDGF